MRDYLDTTTGGGGGSIRRIQITLTADSLGDVTPVTLSPFTGQILDYEGFAGSPAPTNGWSVSLTDDLGSTSAYATYDHPLTVSINGNAVADAQMTVVIRYSPQPVGR